MPAHAQLTAEQRDLMVRLYVSGLSSAKAAAAVGAKFNACLNEVRRRGLPVRPPKGTPPDVRDRIIDAFRGGMTLNQVAAAFSTGRDTVSRILVAAGINPRRSGAVSRGLTGCERAGIVADYTAGVRMKDLAAAFGVSCSSVERIVSAAGATKPLSIAQRRCEVDDTAFDEPLTPEARRWVGFLMADGCIRRQPRCKTYAISLGLSRRDTAHVLKFRRFLRSTHAVRAIKRQEVMITPDGYIAHPRPAVQFVVSSSERLVESLARYGVVPQKSLTAEVRGGLEMCPSFWGGMIDGDGCVGLSNSAPAVSLVGSHIMMCQFADFVRTLYPPTMAAAQPRKGRSISSFRVSHHAAVAVLRACYPQDCRGWALFRKWKKARRLLAEWDAVPRRACSRKAQTDARPPRHGLASSVTTTSFVPPDW